MFKKIALAAGVLLMGASAAAADPVKVYGNVENNAGWTGSSALGSATDVHVGIKGTQGSFDWYLQGGPQIQTPHGGDTDVVFSGKVGAGVPISEKLSAYGEASMVSGKGENGYFTKLGVVYDF
tara:strand:- start:1578 stop:1946 length:369 start_codon:yes stop_codon:yes gene_type:complete